MISAAHKAFAVLLQTLLLLLLCLTGCGGGGGSDAQGFGTEGTGYKSFEIPIVGSLKDAAGSPIAGARIETDNADTITDELGVFGLVTQITEGVSEQIVVKSAAIDDAVLLTPIAQPTDPTSTLSVDLKVDAALRVSIERQEIVIGKGSTGEQAAARTEESLDTLIRDTRSEVNGGASSSADYQHDPDFVDLIPEG